MGRAYASHRVAKIKDLNLNYKRGKINLWYVTARLIWRGITWDVVNWRRSEEMKASSCDLCIHLFTILWQFCKRIIWYGGTYCQRVFGTSVAVVCRSCCCHYSILIRPKMRVYLRVFVMDSVTVEMVVVKIWIFCHFRILAFHVAGSVASCHAACFLFVSPVYAWLIDCMQVHSLNAVQRKVSADDVHIIWNELMASVPMNNACILGQSWRTSFHRYRTEVV